MNRSFAVFAGGLLALIVGSLALVTAISKAQSKEGAVSATYLHGVLHVSIPYSAPRSGEGDLTVEVLDPEDHTVGRLDRSVYATAGRGFQEQDLDSSRPAPASMTSPGIGFATGSLIGAKAPHPCAESRRFRGFCGVRPFTYWPSNLT